MAYSNIYNTFTAIPKPGVGHTIQLCNIFIIVINHLLVFIIPL